jgi:hypothetical protein
MLDIPPLVGLFCLDTDFDDLDDTYYVFNAISIKINLSITSLIFEDYFHI